MKLLLLLILVSSSCLAQENTKSLGVETGYDNYTLGEHGWNVGILGQFKFKEGSSWYHEYGVSYSVMEFNHNGEVVLDVNDYEEPLSSGLSGGGFPNVIIYKRRSDLRVQVGIGYTLFERGDHKLSTGWNLSTSLILKERYNGEVIYSEFEYTDTSQTFVGNKHVTYSYNYPSRWDYYVEFLPYLNYNLQISVRFSLKTRFRIFLPIIRNYRSGFHSQLNIGLNYEF
jgi:hypothetical protein